MRHQPDDKAGWTSAQFGAQPASGLPNPMDCETRALLRLFLAPILETASTWTELAERLALKGFALTFRQGHLVILNEDGAPLCTGSDMGVPMAKIAARIGRASVRAHRGGATGTLRRA